MICKDCIKFAKFSNSNELGLGICQHDPNLQIVKMNNECLYKSKPYKCKDCQHKWEGDTACFFVNPEDDICASFEDHQCYEMTNIIFNWISHGKTDKECLNLFEKCLIDAKNITATLDKI